uniref:ATP synthase subunit a n=1 Tax=Xibalbanus tulumensis TaxID=1519145 RepID=Q6SKY8_XIBTU|nr:ATP synthase F0 subunit 6 [Xibalbanus tulumensis]AAS00885.1 ATP synthase F0 subunit 6 [Xibalbanus tulumensis]
MMTNLFSTFDPTTMNNMQMNWIQMMTPLFMIPSVFWMIPSRSNMTMNIITKKLSQEMSTLMKNPKATESILTTSLFINIVLINLPGLTPYTFTSTTHLSITLSFALPMWLMPLMYLMIKKNQTLFSHMIPLGTPTLLMPFMVMIETMSNLIRPITLSVRLAANMIAGHLLITLLSMNSPEVSTSKQTLIILSLFMLTILESAVAVIQSYVFSTLSTLYLSESS